MTLTRPQTPSPEGEGAKKDARREAAGEAGKGRQGRKGKRKRRREAQGTTKEKQVRIPLGESRFWTSANHCDWPLGSTLTHQNK